VPQIPESCRSVFVHRSIFGGSGPFFAENAPAHEIAPTKPRHSGPEPMIPETFRHRSRKLSATAVLVDQQQVACLPRHPPQHGTVAAEHGRHDFADRTAATEPGVERQAAVAERGEQHLPLLRIQAPLAEELDVIEPALGSGHRMTDDRRPSLGEMQHAIGLPGNADRARQADLLDLLRTRPARRGRSGQTELRPEVAFEQPSRGPEPGHQLRRQVMQRCASVADQHRALRSAPGPGTRSIGNVTRKSTPSSGSAPWNSSPNEPNAAPPPARRSTPWRAR